MWIEEGSPSAPLWICGEAPGEQELSQRRPFVGASGYLLNELLHEVGFNRREFFLTNVCHERPPSYRNASGKVINNDIGQFFANKTNAKRLGLAEIMGRWPTEHITSGLERLRHLLTHHRPRLIIALGNTAMWALTGNNGITKWRGSVLETEAGVKVLATFHPSEVLSHSPNHRPILLQDLRRAKRESTHPEVRRPTWHFTVPDSPAMAVEWFADHATDASVPLICDTEGWGRVDCIGFASDPHNAICIPFTHPAATEPADAHYWNEEDEFALTQACRTVLCSRPIVFHNALWDCQVIGRRWGMLPRLHADTMVAQHVAFPGLLGGRIDPVTGEVDKKGSSLSLSFIASMYCDYYRYWKDDGRHFDPAVHDEQQYWRYNCEDTIRTYECYNTLCASGGIIDTLNLREQFQMEMDLFGPVLTMMFRGIRYDVAGARAAYRQLASSRDECKRWLDTAVGCDFNPDSTPQMRALFYEDLLVPQIKSRKTGAPTLDDAALDTIARRTPLLRPLVAQIQNYRTLDTLRSSIAEEGADGRLNVPVSPSDHRLRFCLNIGFVETMRFSCNESAFGEGGNIQNIKRPDDD